MALPWLEAMTPAFASSLAAQTPRRFVSISLALGLHGPNLNPADSGYNYTPSLYLSKISDLLGDLTVVTGSSHPGVSGGHNAEGSILSAAPYSKNAAFKTPFRSTNIWLSTWGIILATPQWSSMLEATIAPPTQKRAA